MELLITNGLTTEIKLSKQNKMLFIQQDKSASEMISIIQMRFYFLNDLLKDALQE